MLPTPSASLVNDGEDVDQWDARRARVKASRVNGNGMGEPLTIAAQRLSRATGWGECTAAINHWAQNIGRPAPPPTVPDGRGGKHRLSPAFAEWMMGLPEGWVTDAPISRKQQLKALGNGVVPAQCSAALRDMLANTEVGQLAA